MAEATQTYHRRGTFDLRRAVAVLARQAAIKATKAALQRQGLKLTHFRQKDIVALAEEYLATHRDELVAEATVIAKQWQAEDERRREARRRRRLLERNSKDLHSARRPDPHGLSLCRTHERNGDAK
jgi:tmRNA-binding protein